MQPHTSVYVEKDCTISFDGKTFTANGAFISPTHVIGYPDANGVLTDWHGEMIGTWRSVATWPVHSHWGSHMHQIEATINGVVYTGRGFGQGMIYRGKRKIKR